MKHYHIRHIIHYDRKKFYSQRPNSFQLVLDEDEETDRKLANKLITIYFSFFKSTIKKGEIDSKLVNPM
jgi:hypothetical protein